MAKRQSPTPEPEPEPAQSGEHRNVARTAVILDALASSKNAGLRLTDVMHATGLKKTVAYRGLMGLVAYGMAHYDRNTSRFYLGDRLFAWVKRAGDRFLLAERIEPYVRALAMDLEDNSYFLLRRGDNALCLGFAEGSFPIKSLTLNVGDLRPLGAGSGPLAILAFQPDDEIEEILAATKKERAELDISDDKVRRNVAQTRKSGYAIHEGLFFKMMTGVAVPVRNPRGEYVASFSIVAIASRLEPPRLKEVLTRMRAAVKEAEEQLGPLLADVMYPHV
ncbi:MAG: IclR family transcriptional regulator [Planctomycetaceae bacterium]|nr:IclR family transcriptional regulator [Planctomycetaceae bacterium]